MRRQHETSTGHSGAAAAASRAAHGHAGGQCAGDRRRAGNHRSGPVQQSCTVAVLRTGAKRVYGGAERRADDGRHAVGDALTNPVAVPHPTDPLALKCSWRKIEGRKFSFVGDDNVHSFNRMDFCSVLSPAVVLSGREMSMPFLI